jgi:hypothetical protein
LFYKRMLRAPQLSQRATSAAGKHGCRQLMPAREGTFRRPAFGRRPVSASTYDEPSAFDEEEASASGMCQRLLGIILTQLGSSKMTGSGVGSDVRSVTTWHAYPYKSWK